MKEQSSIRAAMIGDLCLDVFFQIPEYPQKGGDGLAAKLVKQSGGSVANTAIALAHLGYEPHLFTHTGNDLWAQEVLNILDQEGVILDHVVKEEHETTGITFLAVTPDGERTMFTCRGANAMLDPQEITQDALDDFSILHISGYACMAQPQSDAVMKAVEIAHQKNMLMSLDIGVEPAHKMGELLQRMLPSLSLIILGEPEICAASGTSSVQDAIMYLIDRGVKVVALKRGKDGCLLATKERQVAVSGFHINVIDTTGSGDSFGAAMIHGLSRRWSLEATGVLANAMGALAATRWGAGAALPRAEEIVRFLSLPENRTQENTAWIQEIVSELKK